MVVYASSVTIVYPSIFLPACLLSVCPSVYFIHVLFFIGLSVCLVCGFFVLLSVCLTVQNSTVFLRYVPMKRSNHFFNKLHLFFSHCVCINFWNRIYIFRMFFIKARYDFGEHTRNRQSNEEFCSILISLTVPPPPTQPPPTPTPKQKEKKEKRNSSYKRLDDFYFTW